MLAGGFVAGLDAGLTYNTFPLMDGKFIPDGLLSMSPVFLNFFENVKVNDDSGDIRKNRLELLNFFCKTYENFIDFQLIKDINE